MESSPPFLLGRILAVIEMAVGSVPDDIADAIRLDPIGGLAQLLRYSYGTLRENERSKLKSLFAMLDEPPDESVRGNELVFWCGYYHELSLARSED